VFVRVDNLVVKGMLFTDSSNIVLSTVCYLVYVCLCPSSRSCPHVKRSL